MLDPSIPIRVAIRQVEGKELEVEAAAGSTVHELKLRVSEAWKMFPECQKCVTGSEVMDDQSTLVEYLEGDSTELALTVIFSLDFVLSQLGQQEVAHRQSALHMVTELAKRGYLSDDYLDKDERLGNALRYQFDHADPSLRRGALELAFRLVKNPDESFMAAVTIRLTDINVYVRRAAMEGLTRLAQSGVAMPDSLVKDVLARLDDKDTIVSQWAAEALAWLVPRGDERVIQQLSARLADAPAWAEVRRLAACVLAEVAPVGDAAVLGTLKGLLSDKRANVRKAALQATCKLSGKGDEEIIKAACTCLQDGDRSVSHAAVRALAYMTEIGDERTIAAALALLLDEDHAERLRAVRLLTQVAEKGDERVIKRLCALFEDKRFSVRLLAGDALPQLTVQGDERTVALMRDLLKHEETYVRLSVIKALPRVAEEVSQDVLTAVHELAAADASEPVRLACARALTRLRLAPVPRAAECSPVEEHSSEDIKDAAAQDRTEGRGDLEASNVEPSVLEASLLEVDMV